LAEETSQLTADSTGAPDPFVSGGLLGGAWVARLAADLGDGRFGGAWLVKGFGRFCRTKAVTGRPPDPNSDLKRLCYVLRGEFW
jgi:hypothetical protein